MADLTVEGVIGGGESGVMGVSGHMGDWGDIAAPD